MPEFPLREKILYVALVGGTIIGGWAFVSYVVYWTYQALVN